MCCLQNALLYPCAVIRSASELFLATLVRREVVPRNLDTTFWHIVFTQFLEVLYQTQHVNVKLIVPTFRMCLPFGLKTLVRSDTVEIHLCSFLFF